MTRRPVLFRYTREEEFIANTSHRRESHRQTGREDGRLTAVKMDFRANTGPYGNHSLTVPCNGPALSLPLYPCDNVDFRGHHLLQQHLPKWCLSGLWRTER